MAALRHCTSLALLGAACVAACITAAAAQPACGPFTWELGRRVDVLAGYAPRVASGHSLPKEGVFDLALKRASTVVLPVKTDDPHGDGYAGFMTVETVPDGRYLIVLAEDVRLTAVQDHTLLPLLAEIVYDSACPTAYRGIEIAAARGPLTLQISSARTPAIRIALVRIWR